MLSLEEKQTFEEEGLVVPGYRLPDDLMGDLRALTDRVIAETPKIPPDFLFSPHLPWAGQKDTSLSDGFMAICRRPEILDAVESLIGSDIILWASRIFCKPARTGLEIPWHQDGTSGWPMRPLASVAVWIAVDDSTAENGCMRYIPGSHKLGELPFEFSSRTDLAVNVEIDNREFDASTARDNVLESGQFSIHHMFLVHSSRPNLSGKRRAGFAMRVMPATSHYDRSNVVESPSNRYDFDLANAPLFLLRGVDACGRNDIVTGPVEPLALKKIG